MNLLKKLLNKFNGLYYPQEYLCLSKESFQQPLHVYLSDNMKLIKDITNSHLFNGYSPLILILFFSSIEDQLLPDNIEIVFSHHTLDPNEIVKQKDAIGRLYLKLIRKQAAGDYSLGYYEGTKGQHHFLSTFHHYIIRLKNNLYNKQIGNVFLEGNLYKQVQIAYAVPRIISLITVANGDLYNLFPTDLQGPVNEQFYSVSLRINGKACMQVESAKRIVISEMHSDAYKIVYSLGKNHMQELKLKDNFSFSESVSAILKLPLPKLALKYRELELIESFEHGIHKLFLFKVISHHIISDEKATLAHIHNVYATWRHNKGLEGNYLLR